MRRLQIDPKHLAVIASLAIFFAWSVDNLIKKSIDGTVSAISSAEEAWIQADRYQELARYQQEIFTALKGLFMEFVRVHGDKLGMSKIQHGYINNNYPKKYPFISIF
jgi:hypothetical protein